MDKGHELDKLFTQTVDERLRSSLLEDFEILGNQRNPVAVHADSPKELKRYVMAALLANLMGLKSIDYALKKYGEDWNFDPDTDEERNLCKEILKQVRNNVSQTVKWMEKVENKPDRVGLFSAGAALMRLQASFATASLLIKRGYNFEALSICRLILEQIAWAYDVHELEDGTLFKRKPSNSITKLKSILPETRQLYGLLSEHAHISPHLVPGYVTFEPTNQLVTLLTTKGSASNAFILLLLADAFAVVSEYVYGELAGNFSCLVKDQNGSYCLNKSRESSKVIEHYGNAVSKLKPQQKKETK
jgi:hypothetical protein